MLLLAALLVAAVLLASGCVRSQAAHSEQLALPSNASSQELSAFHKGSLNLADKSGAPRKIYVDCHGSEARAPHLARYLANALDKGKFRLVNSPSEAGYILHINVLKHGAVAPEILKKVVDRGYGSKANFSGNGADGIVVDALMVQRRVPEETRPSRQKMKNISARNALASKQLRIGVLGTGRNHDSEAYSRAIARELAQRVLK